MMEDKMDGLGCLAAFIFVLAITGYFIWDSSIDVDTDETTKEKWDGPDLRG